MIFESKTMVLMVPPSGIKKLVIDKKRYRTKIKFMLHLFYPIRIPKKYVFQFSNNEEQELFVKNIQDFQTIEIEEKKINDLLTKLTINEFGQIKYLTDWNKEKSNKFVKKILKMDQQIPQG